MITPALAQAPRDISFVVFESTDGDLYLDTQPLFENYRGWMLSYEVFQLGGCTVAIYLPLTLAYSTFDSLMIFLQINEVLAARDLPTFWTNGVAVSLDAENERVAFGEPVQPLYREPDGRLVCVQADPARRDGVPIHIDEDLVIYE